MGQVLHRERVPFEGFQLVVGFSCTSEKNLIAVLLPLKDTSGESQSIWLVSGSSLKDNDTDLLLTVFEIRAIS